MAVDGGVKRDTASEIARAGTDVFISGSAFFSAEDPGSEVAYYKGALGSAVV